jgi:uncharacterized protein
VRPSAAFRYVLNPFDRLSFDWTDELRSCGVCGRSASGYEGPYTGQRDCDFACMECITSGKLEAAGLSTNEGDVAALRNQLAAMQPGERDRIVRERTGELEFRTPPLITWQDILWPAHCGDYCRFEGEVGLRELSSLSAEGDGWEYFLEHVDEPVPEDLGPDDLPEQLSEDGRASSLAVYHFRCLGCAQSVIRWDLD